MQLEALLQSGNGYLLGVVVVGGFSLLLSLFILPLLNEKNSQVYTCTTNHMLTVVYMYYRVRLRCDTGSVSLNAGKTSPAHQWCQVILLLDVHSDTGCPALRGHHPSCGCHLCCLSAGGVCRREPGCSGCPAGEDHSHCAPVTTSPPMIPGGVLCEWYSSGLPLLLCLHRWTYSLCCSCVPSLSPNQPGRQTRATASAV